VTATHTYKAIFFTYTAAIGALTPFLSLYYQSRGLSGSQIGRIVAIPPFLTLLSAALWNAVADRYAAHRIVMIGMLTGSGVTAILISLSGSFWLILTFTLLYAVFAGSLSPLISGITMQFLQGQRERFGVYRLWGSVGWTLSTVSVGRLADLAGLRLIFIVHSLLLFASGWLAWTLRLSSGVSQHTPTVWQDLGRLLRDLRWRIFLISSLLMAMAISNLYSFMPLLARRLGGSSGLIGATFALQSLLEVPILFYGAPILRRLGLERAIVLSMLLFSLRLAAYAWIPAAIWILPLGLLHSVTWGLLTLAYVTYADLLAPPGLQATAQGLHQGVFRGLAFGLGSVVGGVIFDGLGASWLFMLSGATGLLATLLFLSSNQN